MKNFCRECGTELDPGDLFCAECGTTVKNNNSPVISNQTVQIKKSVNSSITPPMPYVRTNASNNTTAIILVLLVLTGIIVPLFALFGIFGISSIFLPTSYLQLPSLPELPSMHSVPMISTSPIFIFVLIGFVSMVVIGLVIVILVMRANKGWNTRYH